MKYLIIIFLLLSCDLVPHVNSDLKLRRKSKLESRKVKIVKCINGTEDQKLNISFRIYKLKTYSKIGIIKSISNTFITINNQKLDSEINKCIYENIKDLRFELIDRRVSFVIIKITI